MHYQDGASWNEIAAGLAAQGVTQGGGQPLTGRRLTALMHNIRVRTEKLKSKGALRSTRENLSNTIQRLDGQSRKTVSLAPELSRPRSETQPD